MPRLSFQPTSDSPIRPKNFTRYLGRRSFPNEGAFHLYEDGYRFPTQVDGEEVNPRWGLTKANKARKRPAVACLDCREKKTKCELGVNACSQCIKGKRICRQYVLVFLDLTLTLTLSRAPRGLSSSGRDIVLGISISSASSLYQATAERLPDVDLQSFSSPYHAARRDNCLQVDDPSSK
jgi:hypothetical protein